METEIKVNSEEEDSLFLTSNMIDSSHDIRLELEKYLENSMNQLDSEGNKLLYYPSNYENIVDTMNRDDILMHDEDRPWSKYLLENSINSEIDKSLGNRYKNILLNDLSDENNKLDEEFKTIQLLDEKLKDLNKKNRKNNESISTPRSTVSYNKDFTFLTRQKGSSSVYTSDKESERPESVPPSSPGTVDDNNINVNDFNNDYNNNTTNDDDISNDQLTAILDNVLASNSANNKYLPSKKQKDIIKNNINKVKLNNNSSLSVEEEERLQNILDNDLSADEMLYGFTTNDLEHLNKVDNDLNKYGNLNRLSNLEAKGLNGYDISELITINNTITHHVNDTYLKDHRIERLTKNYVKVIDSLILNSSLTIDDITSLYSNNNINNYTTNNTSVNENLLDIPNVENLNGYRKIKYNDIKNIIHEIYSNSNNENDTNNTNNTNNNNTWKLYKKRQELDNLISSIKPLMDQLNILKNNDNSSNNNITEDITENYIQVVSKIPSLPILTISSRTSTPNTSRNFDETIFPPVDNHFLPVPPNNEKCIV